jgi:murein DD-endopeptidase MepM/ murein hydrolase activator NlpD
MQRVTTLGIPASAGVLLFALAAAPSAAHARPWEAREPAVEPKPAHQLRNPATWPAEPDAPAPLDDTKFAAAWAHICGVAPGSPAAALAPKIVAAATAAKSDPFALAALARYGSHCDPTYKGKTTYGLLGIEPGLYRVAGAPDLPVDRADLTSKRLLDPDVNLAVGAALLQMWSASHKEIDAAFGGGLHRGGIAHFIWGDVVRSSGQEDLILTARRRMIDTYLAKTQEPRLAAYIGVPIVSPLEAVPRVATSGPGDDRSGGARRHRGLDIAGMLGEPVRAIADGTVIFAGINSPTRARMGNISPDKIARYKHRRMGVGGIYVCIEHTPEPRRVVSCYMHLGGYNVAEREEVKAGQVIGELGRTGVKVSPPHLHLEVRVGERFTNPVRTLGDYVIPPKDTMTHQYNVRAQRARLRSLRS